MKKHSKHFCKNDFHYIAKLKKASIFVSYPNFREPNSAENASLPNKNLVPNWTTSKRVSSIYSVCKIYGQNNKSIIHTNFFKSPKQNSHFKLEETANSWRRYQLLTTLPKESSKELEKLFTKIEKRLSWS